MLDDVQERRRSRDWKQNQKFVVCLDASSGCYGDTGNALIVGAIIVLVVIIDGEYK